MLADAADRLLPDRGAGLWAAALLNATPLLGVGAVIMTPDTPLLFFWTATIWAAFRLARPGPDEPGTRVGTAGVGRWWLAIGACAGLALASKYTAVMVWGGIALWLLLCPAMQPWLRRPHPWIGAGLGAAVFLPVVWWNAAHGWASFLRQGSRVGDWRPERAVQYLAELIGGQIGLVTPGIWVLALAGIVLATGRAWRRREPNWTLLALLTLPPALVFLQHAFGDRVQGNWPAILYPAALIAAAGLGAPVWRRLRGPAVILGFGMTAIVWFHGLTALPPVPARLDPVALRLDGWDNVARRIETVRAAVGASFVASEPYAVTAELAWMLPRDVAMVGVDPRWTLFRLPAFPLGEGLGLLLRDARERPPDRAEWGAVEPVADVTREVRGTPFETYRLYRVDPQQDRGTAAVLLPRP
jgi:hypothetical protein